MAPKSPWMALVAPARGAEGKHREVTATISSMCDSKCIDRCEVGTSSSHSHPRPTPGVTTFNASGRTFYFTSKCVSCLCFFFFLRLYLFILFIFREREGKDKERETSMCDCVSCAPYWGPGPLGNRTSNPLVCRFNSLYSIH